MGPIALLRGAPPVLVALLPLFWALDLQQYLNLGLFPEQIAGLIMAAACAAVFMARRPGVLEWILAAAAMATGIHILVRFPVLSEGAFFYPTETLILGIVVSITVIEALRRSSGYSLIAILALLTCYALFADLVPGRLQGRPTDWQDILRFVGTDSTATLGAPLQVASFIVVLFIFFGRLLVVTGGAEALTDAARALAGDRTGSTAKMAVIASGFMGSISGSAVSNVMSTGVVTIPAMKKAGFQPSTAGAIEAVASTGGQVMPPVMGAAAFLMAEFLQLPYQDVLLAALIPAALYFYAVYLQISFLAEKHALGAGSAGARVPWRLLLPRLAIVLVPMVVLLSGLFLFYLPAGTAVVWAALALILVGLLDLTRRGRLGLDEVWIALVDTGRSSAQIIAVCAVAGMIIGLLSTSGLAFGLSFTLLDLGEDSLLLLLVLTALVSIVLGMGLPTSGVYLLLATLAAPPLVELGIAPVPAHFFVLYFGLLSMITPPVALAAFAAASISGAGAMQTAVESVRFGWIAFLLPFVFVYRPAYLMQGEVLQVVTVSAFALVAVPLATAAIIGYGRRQLGPPERAVALVVAALALIPIGSEGLAFWLSVGATGVGLALIAMHVRGVALAEAGR